MTGNKGFDLDFRQRDVLPIKITGDRIGKPATPSGKTYSDTTFYLYGGPNPVYQIHDIGDTVPMKLIRWKGRLTAKNRETSKPLTQVYKEWVQLQNHRNDDCSSTFVLDDVPDNFSPDDIMSELNQDDDDKKETTEVDDWSESKSDKMSDLL